MVVFRSLLYFHIFAPTGDSLKDDAEGTWLTKALTLPFIPFVDLRIYTHPKQEVRDVVSCVAYDEAEELVYVLVRPLHADDAASVKDYVDEQKRYGWKICKAEEVPECFSGIEALDRYED